MGPLAHPDAMHRLELNEIHATNFNGVGDTANLLGARIESHKSCRFPSLSDPLLRCVATKSTYILNSHCLCPMSTSGLKNTTSSRRSVLNRTTFRALCELSSPHAFSIEDIQTSMESAESGLGSFWEADVQDVTCFSTKVVS